MAKNNYIDLHVHTNKSDGMYSPQEVIRMAQDNETKILSIADHDSIEAIPEFENSITKNMIGVKGIEFSSYINYKNQRIRIHILGYCFDENNENFAKLLKEQTEKRNNAHIELLNDLKKRLKTIPEENILKLNMDRYCWFDREVIKCFEAANCEEKIITDLKKYYRENRFSYGKYYEIEAKSVIDIIHSAGGYAIFAHPMAYKLDVITVFDILKQLKENGIDGIETYQSDCSDYCSILLNKFVVDNNLLNSVGSDFHRIINSDGRQISKGINDNLCINETLLTNKILKRKQYFTKNT